MHFFTSSQCFWMALTLQNLKLVGNLEFSRFQWHTNTYINVGQKLNKNAQYIFYLHIFISWKKGGQSIKYIFHLQWNAVLTQIMLCLAEAVLRNNRFFGVNPYWISTRKVKKNCEALFRFEQYLKILQLYHENSRFPPSLKFWSAIQKHWEEVTKCILECGAYANNAMSSRSSFTK
jgi:hypothetical protein